jgi:predicted nuclease of predicted toxin-antitoxin system
MRFFCDQDVYRLTVEFLISLGHDVLTAADVGMSQAVDREILRFAATHSRILITRDKDFGSLVFSRMFSHSGVILLRVTPLTLSDIHTELARFLSLQAEEVIQRSFVVVEKDRHRIRRID